MTLYSELPIKYLDFAKELDRLSKVGGSFRWFALRKPDLSKKCTCAGNSRCKRCFDTGYLFSDELVKVYTWAAVFGVEFQTKAGSISTQTKNFVIEYSRDLSKQDYLLELDIDMVSGEPIQPFKIMRAYKLADYAIITARDNKPAYWMANAEEREFSDGKPPTDGTGYEHSIFK